MRTKLALFSLIVILFFIFFLQIFLSFSQKNYEIRSQAFEPRKNINLFGENNITSIQNMINSANNNDIITIPPGTYSGSTAIPLSSSRPFVNKDRGGSDTCFLRIENKNLTLEGKGAILFGEGHDKPYQDPYQNRAGLCILNSNVIINGLRVKEFQKRCLVVVDSNIIYKNGVVDGCDEGGISLLGNSTALILNNLIVGHNFGGVMLWQNSQAKIINNIFYNAGIMFFYHPRTDDNAFAEITNNIFQGGEENITQVDWWKEKASKLKNNKVSYNLFSQKNPACNQNLHFCEDFPGKIIGDPLYIEPVVDPRGIAAWANFALKEGSPAIGSGNPQLPGPKNLGISGGPCADGNSSTCLSFIEQLKQQLIQVATPTPLIETFEPTISSPSEVYPTSHWQPTTSYPADLFPSQNPPITYYLPPTLTYHQPTRENDKNYPLPSDLPSVPSSPSPSLTPTITPTPKPMINLKETLEKTQSIFHEFLNTFLRFTQTILP